MIIGDIKRLAVIKTDHIVRCDDSRVFYCLYMGQDRATDACFKYFYDRVRAYEFRRLAIRRSTVIDEVHKETVRICRRGNDIHAVERQTAVAGEVGELKTRGFG